MAKNNIRPRDDNNVDLQSGDILSETEARYIQQLEKLWDMLSETIEGGRLNEIDIPDDYQAFVQQMIKLNKTLDKRVKEDEEDSN